MKKFWLISTIILILISFGGASIKKEAFGANQTVFLGSKQGLKEIIKIKRPSPLSYSYSYTKTLQNIKFRPGTWYKKDSKETPQNLNHCKSIISRTFSILPETHASLIKIMTLYFTKDGRRGLAGNGQIILRCQNVDDKELAAVLTHEIGHLVDTMMLNGTEDFAETEFDDFGDPIFENDKSVDFYRIDFKNTTERKKSSSILNFVSTYGASDPFEDFAETYAYYVFHGPEFRFLAANNSALAKKYEFMKKVFHGKEFGDGVEKTDLFTRTYDVTVLTY